MDSGLRSSAATIRTLHKDARTGDFGAEGASIFRPGKRVGTGTLTPG